MCRRVCKHQEYINNLPEESDSEDSTDSESETDSLAEAVEVEARDFTRYPAWLSDDYE